MNHRRIIWIFYAVTLANLPLLLLAARRGRVAFVTMSDRVAHRFGGLLSRIGACQISEKDDLERGLYYQGRLNVVDAAHALGRRHPAIGEGFARIGGNERYRRFSDSMFIPSLNPTAFMVPYLSLFAERAAQRQESPVLVSGFSKSAFGTALASAPLDWFRGNGILSLTGLPARIMSVLLLGAFPLLNTIYLLRKGVRPSFSGPSRAESRKILFVHREAELLPPQFRYRDMYLMNHELLAPGECQHMLMASSLSFGRRKRKMLEEAGGVVVATNDLRPGWRTFFRTVLCNPWRGLLQLSVGVICCTAWRWTSTKALLENLHFMALCPMLLDHADGRVVVFETEVAPLVQVMAIEARKRGRRTISMIHGSGAQHTVSTTRVEIQVAEMITYGSWDEALRRANPAIETCVPVGNIEIDRPDRSGSCLPESLRAQRSKIKIIGFLARQSHVLSANRSTVTHTAYLDIDGWDESRRRYFEPFLLWVAERPDLVLLWKAPLDGIGKVRPHGGIEWAPWLAPLMAAIPEERFLFFPDATLEEIVGNLDLAICNDVSSAFACAVSVGTPALSMDLIFGGMFRRYHPRAAAVTGSELAENAEWLLTHQLPPEVYQHFNQDFYGMPEPDFRTGERLKNFFDRLIADV